MASPITLATTDHSGHHPAVLGKALPFQFESCDDVNVDQSTQGIEIQVNADCNRQYFIKLAYPDNIDKVFGESITVELRKMRDTIQYASYQEPVSDKAHLVVVITTREDKILNKHQIAQLIIKASRSVIQTIKDMKASFLITLNNY
jgi:citrate lyase gamma subunit